MKELMKGAVFILLLTTCSVVLTAQQPAAAPAKQGQTAGKQVPQAKTHPEFNDYNTAYAIAGGAASEKAADEFAAKYPDSELKSFLYAKAMHEYQTENNQAKILAMGERVLQFDPDNPIALVLTANALLDGLGEADKDRERKIAEIKKNSSHALQTIDTNFVPPAGTPPAQVTAYKKTMQSLAHSALGIVALKTDDDAVAETELQAAAELNGGPPDPVIWFDLALAQDHQQKYAEALVSINKAVQYAGSDPDLATRVRGELMRLRTLNQSTPR